MFSASCAYLGAGAGWTQGAAQGMRFVVPAQVDMQLTRPQERDAPLPEHWRLFVDPDAVSRVRDRLGLTRAEKKEKK